MMIARSSTADALGRVDRFFQFALLGLVTSGYLAVAGSGYLDPVTMAATGAAILVRSLLVAARRELSVPERWVNAATLAYIGFYPLDYLFLSSAFLPATVHLVLFLAVVKILTARQGRDYLFVVVVAFLELLAASLLSTRLNYFVFLAAFLVFAVSTFASWEIRQAAEGSGRVAREGARVLPWRLAGLAAVVSGGILLITAVLFFVLPRTARAAFERLVPERFHVTAFSNQVTIGEIGEVKQLSTVWMHVRILGANKLMPLKWRGTALAEFDGRRWFNSDEKGVPVRFDTGMLQLAKDEDRRRVGRRLNYEVQLKPFAADTLFIAGEPEFLRINAPLVIRTREDAYRVGYRGSGVLRYGVYSFLPPPVSQPPGRRVVPPLDDRKRYLRLPPLDPRIGALARRITAASSRDEDKAVALERFLQTRFGYTLELPKHEEKAPIAQFLFTRKKGHCEYFASAMAVMLRMVGIPSRVATGFQGGIYNPISGWQVVRASDAHSWVEAFLSDRGWTTFDPTPPDPSAGGGSLWSRAGLLFDAADTFWQEWVLSYDLDRQLTLAAEMRKSRRRLSLGWLGGASELWDGVRRKVSQWIRTRGAVTLGLLLFAFAAAILGPVVRRWWAGRQRAWRVEHGDAVATDATAMYLRALLMLKGSGFQKPAWVTPGEFVRQVPGPAAPVMEKLTDAYQELRFGGNQEAAPRLSASLGELEQALKGNPAQYNEK